VHRLQQGLTGVLLGFQPSTVRARVVSSSGVRRPMSTQPGSVGCRCSRQLSSTSPRSTAAGSGKVRDPRIAAIVGESSTGSVAMLNAPVTGEVQARTYARAMSAACTTWKASESTSGTSGSRAGPDHGLRHERPRK
jgi:hypothetical protein